MLRPVLLLTLAAASLAGTAFADVYKYKDEKGNIQYTDKPPSLPAERLNVKSQKTDIVAMQERQEAEMKRLQESSETRQQATAQRLPLRHRAGGRQRVPSAIGLAPAPGRINQPLGKGRLRGFPGVAPGGDLAEDQGGHRRYHGNRSADRRA